MAPNRKEPSLVRNPHGIELTSHPSVSNVPYGFCRMWRSIFMKKTKWLCFVLFSIRDFFQAASCSNWLIVVVSTVPPDCNSSFKHKMRISDSRWSFFFMSMLLHIDKTRSRHVGNTQLRISIPCVIFTRLGSFRIPLLPFNSYEEFQKMARWMIHANRERFLLARHS